MPKVRDIMTVGVRTADPETACFRYGDIAVKHKNERLGGQALEDISEGVKPSRGVQTRKKTISISGGRRSAELGPGITHQRAQREQQRQQRVSPARASTRGGRKAS